MIGLPRMWVYGVSAGGEEQPLLVDGRWQI
jgi:hypothetical protein